MSDPRLDACPHLCHGWHEPCTHGDIGWRECSGCIQVRLAIRAIVSEAQARRDSLAPSSAEGTPHQ